MVKVTDIKRSKIESLKLELSYDEIMFLVDVLNRIGGRADTTRRGIGQNILTTLSAAGIDIDPIRSRKDISGHIMFDVTSKKVSEDPYTWPEPEFDEEVPF